MSFREDNTFHPCDKFNRRTGHVRRNANLDGVVEHVRDSPDTNSLFE
jgi:hypothetical protein